MITTKDGFYLVKIPFNLKDRFKACVPSRYRAWEPQSRSWIVTPEGIGTVQAFLESHIGHVEIPPLDATNAIAATIQKTLAVEYIGQCKERDGIVSALGSVRGFWSVEFPEEILKSWFERKPTKDSAQTFYQTLCVFETATADEIKSAHRRLARQWHPDVCGEPEASDKFRELTDAYDILRDPQKRKRYDAGLFFDRESKKSKDAIYHPSDLRHGMRSLYPAYFRAPLRCGLITADGVQRLSRFAVSKILAWDDITDEAGRVMTASWNKFTESIEIKWL
jgi:hypothetical protein